MADLVTVTDIETRLPRPLDDDERDRVGTLITDAVEEIVTAFQKQNRDFAAELQTVSWLPATARKVIREMVSAAVLVGANVGFRSVSSTTGPTSDSATYADVGSVSWAGIELTDDQRSRLGLSTAAHPRGSFPRPPRWPERGLYGRAY